MDSTMVDMGTSMDGGTPSRAVSRIETPTATVGVPIGPEAELMLRDGTEGQTAPRPVRARPVTAFTTTTTRIAPITDTTNELRSNGPSIGWVLKSTPARKPPTRAPTI